MKALFGRGGILPVVLQAERSECALACLAMVLGYYGHRTDLHTLRNRYRISQHGITLKNVIRLAARMNLAARPLRLELADLSRLALPAMLHWHFDHFVVLKQVKGRELEIHNPAAGKQTVSWEEAGKVFSGIALELIPAPGFRRCDDRQHLALGELWSGLPGLGSGLMQLFILSLLLQGFALALPFYTQIVVDDVLINSDMDLLKLLATGFLLLAVFRQLTEWLRARLVLYLGNRVSFQFATRLCRHLLHLPLTYFSRRHIGDTVSRFGSLNAVRDFLCSGMIETFIDGLMVLGALALMVFYDTSLTVIALVAVMVYAVIRLGTYQSLKTRNEEWLNDRAAENTLFMENISCMQGIRLFRREESRLSGWQNSYAAALNAGIRTQALGINIQFAHGLLIGVENIVLLLAGAYAVLAGDMSVGMLMAFISFKDHFYRSMFSLLDRYLEFRLLDMHLGRLADIAFTAPEARAPDALDVLPAPAPVSVTLQDIAFSYDPDQPDLFARVSLNLGARELVAIVGPTGCGKSTLLRIAASLVQPTTGTLLLDGMTVNAHTLDRYRSVIAGVMQNDVLLSGSILENITFFDAAADLARVETAVQMAALAEDIARMPMQLNTMVGSMGSALSGGQVQRILLARAFYQCPRFLVLDEATSHLDIATEKRVNLSIRALGIGCLMVAHRPETVLLADRIMLLTPAGLLPIGHGEFRDLISNKDKDDVITI